MIQDIPPPSPLNDREVNIGPASDSSFFKANNTNNQRFARDKQEKESSMIGGFQMVSPTSKTKIEPNSEIKSGLPPPLPVTRPSLTAAATGSQPQQQLQQQQQQQQQGQNMQESALAVELNKQMKGFNQSMWNSILGVLVILSLLATFTLYWGVFYYDLKCSKQIGLSDGVDRINFILNSATDIDYQDFFVPYKLLLDVMLIFLQVVCVFFPPLNGNTTKIYYVRHVVFYVDFVVSLFDFVKLEPLLYFDSIQDFRARFRRYNEVTAELSSFQSTFENFYVLLKVYVYAVLAGAVLQVMCFGYSTLGPIPPPPPKMKQQKYIIKDEEEEDLPFNFQPEWKTSIPISKDIMIE